MDNYLIINGARVPTPFPCLNWENAPDKVKKHTKVNKRIGRCNLIVMHTIHGEPGRLVPGSKPSALDIGVAHSHFVSSRPASTDAYVDTDGSVVWANDPALTMTWGAPGVNMTGMHIEMCTDLDSTLYQATVDTAGVLVEILCRALGIQMQTPWDFVKDEPHAGRIHRCDDGTGAKNIVGVIGHRNVWGFNHAHVLTNERSFWDPGSFIFKHLVDKHRFEKFDFEAGTDTAEWVKRQLGLGFSAADADGLPMSHTVAALKAAGYPNGIWVRPAA